MIRISNFSVSFDNDESMTDLAARRLRIPPRQISGVVIVRKAIDARRYRGAPLSFVYVLDVKLETGEGQVLAKFKKDKNVELAKVKKLKPIPLVSKAAVSDFRPVVVGFGPAGMFAALTLAKAGLNPLVLERGRDVDSRHRDIDTFWRGGGLDERSNVQFGEGGAGTFSDGKLTTRISDSSMGDILDEFIKAGAPGEIKYLHKPHIGTDLLRKIVKNIRLEIIRLGGEVRFETCVTDIEVKDGSISALIVENSERIPANTVFFGIGHSARDTYAMLHQKGIEMSAKAFAIGVRIEHPQEFIDVSQYGKDAGNPRLPVADYALTYKDYETGRGAYTFCMCPGGQVVAAASEKEHLAINGMSNYHRDSGVANAALLVTVTPEDFGKDVLSGIRFQRQYEHAAFLAGGGDYRAPVQSVGDFLSGKTGASDFLTKPSYLPGVKTANLHDCLPGIVTDVMERALVHFDKKIPGYSNPRVVMTGVETRSSAPCRIERNRETFVSKSLKGLYPMGEGAGYAGGIMSAAVDGRNAVLAFLKENGHTIE